MKNTKRVLAFLVGAAMMLPMASAEGKLASGNYEATSQGFGGAVTVKVTVTDGKVTAATITGDKDWRRRHQDADRKADWCVLCR